MTIVMVTHDAHVAQAADRIVHMVDGRTADGPDAWRQPSPDTHNYVRMIVGEEAPAPFRFRLLVPALASALPLDPLPALALISWLSLAVAFMLLAWCLVTRLGLRPLSALVPDIDVELEKIVLKCLAKEPADRPATARELCDALALCPSRVE